MRGSTRRGRAPASSSLVLVALASLALACGPSETTIREEIAAAEGCQAAGDCIDVGSYCPFGCSIVVNRSAAARITSLLQEYKSSCAYDCRALDRIACEDQRCTAKFQ